MGEDESTRTEASDRGDVGGSPVPRGEAEGGAPGPRGMRRPPGPSRRDVVRGLERELSAAGRAAGVDDPRLEAERLVAHVLGLTRAELSRTGSERLDGADARRLARAAQRRLGGEPLQHIEGTVQFRDLVLTCDRRALIPRPETEQLVDRIVAWARGRVGSGAGPAGVIGVRRSPNRADPLLEGALDIGTGSGAIALSLVHEGIVRRVVGVDVDGAALEQAAANRDAARLDPSRVELRLAEGDAWSAVGKAERFDLIVSNPPYVPDRAIEGLPVHVRDHEPRRALAGGREGLDVIREIVEGAADYLRPDGALFLEIGAEQGEAVRRLLLGGGAWEDAVVERDLGGRDRFVRARPAFREGAR